jgi:hypothetical protein
MTAVAFLLDHLSGCGVVDSADVAYVADTDVHLVSRWSAGTAAARPEAEERLAELRAVVDLALRVMRESDARIWIRAPNRELASAKPLDLIAHGEYRRVIAVLLALGEGVTA